jgi:hypothetical protein
MLEVYLAEKNPPPQERSLALKPKLRSWTGRVWRATPQSFQLMLKLEASLSIPDIANADLRAALSPFAADLSSFALYLDYTDEGKLPLSWAVGVFRLQRGKSAFIRFYDFLETVPAHVLVPLLPSASAESDLILSVVPYRIEKDLLDFVVTDYDLGFHSRIG